MLTETWAASYFQSLIMMLIFTLGVPALVIQLVAPSDGLYRLVHGRFRLTLGAKAVLVASAGVTILFAWVIHPSGAGWKQPWLWIANTLMTLAVLLAAFAWVTYLKKFTRAGILRRIQKAAAQDGNSKRRDHAEANIAMLGEASRSGREKQEILETLHSLLRERIKRAEYDGTRCERLLHAVRRTLLSAGASLNEENHGRAVRLLIESKRRILAARGGALAECSDLLWLNDLIRDLASAGAAAGFQSTHELLEHLPHEGLLEVGIAAWRAGRVDTVGYATTRLQSAHARALEGKEPNAAAAGHALTLLVALLAHVATGGPAARQWSADRLATLRRDLGEDEISRALDRAWEDRYKVGDWTSADVVHALRDASMAPTPGPPGRRARK